MSDYINKCGSCKHFSYYVKDEELVKRGECDCAPTNTFNHTIIIGDKKVTYRPRHSNWRSASNPKCKRYEEYV